MTMMDVPSNTSQNKSLSLFLSGVLSHQWAKVANTEGYWSTSDPFITLNHAVCGIRTLVLTELLRASHLT